jgi:hypothetical protein
LPVYPARLASLANDCNTLIVKDKDVPGIAGNMRTRELFEFLTSVWPHIQVLSGTHKLVSVRRNEIETIE